MKRGKLSRIEKILSAVMVAPTVLGIAGALITKDDKYMLAGYMVSMALLVFPSLINLKKYGAI